MSAALAAVTSALGNRAWGNGPLLGSRNGRVWGVAISTFGIWLSGPYPWWAIPLIAAGYFLFRFKSPRPWFDAMRHRKAPWGPGFIRSLWILPLLCLLIYLNPTVWAKVWGFALIYLIPVAYYVGDRVHEYAGYEREADGTYRKWEGVAIAELLVGLGLGLIGLDWG